MFLIDLHERLKKKPDSKLKSGYVEKIFEFNDRCARDAGGFLPVIIKPTIQEQKKKKSIN